MPKLLIVEDDDGTRENLHEYLKRKNYTVDAVASGKDALAYLDSYNYDAIILDWDLPEISGVEILTQFRARGGQTPVIMLTGKRELTHKETGFGAGADDYLTKPFHEQELAVRLTALLRRPGSYKSERIKIRTLELDSATCRVWLNGSELELQPLEYKLLELFMRNPDQVFPTENIISHCWSADKELAVEALYSCVRRLRRKIDEPGKKSLLATVHGVGYRLDSKDE